MPQRSYAGPIHPHGNAGYSSTSADEEGNTMYEETPADTPLHRVEPIMASGNGGGTARRWSGPGNGLIHRAFTEARQQPQQSYRQQASQRPSSEDPAARSPSNDTPYGDLPANDMSNNSSGPPRHQPEQQRFRPPNTGAPEQGGAPPRWNVNVSRNTQPTYPRQQQPQQQQQQGARGHLPRFSDEASRRFSPYAEAWPDYPYSPVPPPPPQPYSHNDAGQSHMMYGMPPVNGPAYYLPQPYLSSMSYGYPWGGVNAPRLPPSPPPTVAPSRSPDMEKTQLEARLKAFEDHLSIIAQDKETKTMEERIRLEAEADMMRRIEKQRQEEEEAKRVIESAKKDAERSVREAMQAERNKEMEQELVRERLTGNHIRGLEVELRERMRRELEVKHDLKLAEESAMRRAERLDRSSSQETLGHLTVLLTSIIEKLGLQLSSGSPESSSITTGYAPARRADDTAAIHAVDTNARPRESPGADYLTASLPEDLQAYLVHDDSVLGAATQSEQDGEDSDQKSVADSSKAAPPPPTTVFGESEDGQDRFSIMTSSRPYPASPSRASTCQSSPTSRANSDEARDLVDVLLDSPGPPEWRHTSNHSSIATSTSTASDSSETMSENAYTNQRARHGDEWHYPRSRQYSFSRQTYDEARYDQRPYGGWQQEEYHHHHQEEDLYPPLWVEQLVERIVVGVFCRLGDSAFGGGGFRGHMGGPRYGTSYHTDHARAGNEFPFHMDPEESRCQTPLSSQYHPPPWSESRTATEDEHRRATSTQGSTPSGSTETANTDLLGLSDGPGHLGDEAAEMEAAWRYLESGKRTVSPGSSTHESTTVQIDGPVTRLIDAPPIESRPAYGSMGSLGSILGMQL